MVIVIVVLIFLADKRYSLKPVVLGAGLLAMLFHMSGLIFGLYDVTIFGIGYDKYVHFCACICVTVVGYGILNIHNKKDFALKLIAAFLITMGLGSMTENIEFVGSQYLHINGATMFSQGDNLPQTKSDLQVYDTSWDMLFNMFGATAGALLIILYRKRF